MSFTVLIPARLASTRLPRKPLAEIAREFNLALRSVGPVDAALRRPDGSAEAPLAGGDATIQGIFRSEPGVDNEAIRLPRDSGYVWFDVKKIDPSREQGFDEVKAQVETQWRTEEVATRLSAKARELVERLDKGEAFDAAHYDTERAERYRRREGFY